MTVGARVRITVNLTPELQRNLKRSIPLLHEALGLGLDDLAWKIAGKARQKAPKHTGHLARSIATWSPIGQPLIREVGTRVHYAPYIEFGTKPHWPPFAAIRDWVWLNRRKFGINGRGLGAQTSVDNVARAIQRKIAHSGTKAQPYLTPAFQEVLPKIKPVLERYVRVAIGRMGGG